jgi:mono/diheme cytochrome c family protein
MKTAALLIGTFAVTATAALSAVVSEVTFNKDVLPILQKNCQSCHRPGEIGPMSLLDYQSARPWAKAIKSAVATRKMPPWFADPKYGHFSNDRRLTEAQINTLVAWVDAGAPEGDAKDKPAPLKWQDGWNIRPDVVLQMARPFTVPAKGTLQYAYIVIPTGFTKDTWVTAGEIRPGARSVVHHMSAIVRPRGAAWLKDSRIRTIRNRD